MFHLSTAWESVNFETFDQSEHDTRISYHGTAASKAYLQAPPPFPLSQTTTRLASLPDFFFVRLSSTVVPSARLGILGSGIRNTAVRNP